MFKVPVDTIPRYYEQFYKQLRGIYFNLKWNEVFDLLECIYQFRNDDESADFIKNYVENINFVLERESSGYRLVEGNVTNITSEDEIKEIVNAIENSPNSIKIHIDTSLQFLSDRKKPNYRKSIDEAILAVESLCQKLTGNDKATLGDALSALESNGFPFHGALKVAFAKIYGYSSDEKGIRHALSDVSNLQSEDARFMLVACSAFINYLLEKARKVGLNLK